METPAGEVAPSVLTTGARRATLLARAALGGVALYLAIDVALVFLRPQFSVLHNAESDYGSRGHWAWLMDADFVIRCLLSIAVVLAISQMAGPLGRLRTGLALLSVWAVASGLLAFFPDDPVGAAQHGAAQVHLVLAGIAFVAVAVGARVTTRALRVFPGWRPVIGPLALLSYGAFVPVLLLGHAHLRPHSLGGLYEKVFLAMELAWFAVAAAWIAKCAREDSNPRPTA